MPNGNDLSQEDLRKYAKPIEFVKNNVDKLAESRGIQVSYYSKGWPNVRLRWNNAFGLNCLVQLYMDSDMASYILWVAATKDVERHRYMKDVKLHEGLMPPFDVYSMIAEMEKGVDLCNTWTFDDLDFVTKIE